MTHEMVLVGLGGQGGRWCANTLPPNVADGTVEVVAAVDVDPETHLVYHNEEIEDVLANAAEWAAPPANPGHSEQGNYDPSRTSTRSALITATDNGGLVNLSLFS